MQRSFKLFRSGGVNDLELKSIVLVSLASLDIVWFLPLRRAISSLVSQFGRILYGAQLLEIVIFDTWSNQ